MSYLGPDNMELPVDPDAPPEPFSILPSHPRNLQIALLKTIEQGYKLTFVHKDGENPDGLSDEPYEVIAPAEPHDWWECRYPGGFVGEIKLQSQLACGYKIKVVPV